MTGAHENGCHQGAQEVIAEDVSSLFCQKQMEKPRLMSLGALEAQKRCFLLLVTLLLESFSSNFLPVGHGIRTPWLTSTGRSSCIVLGLQLLTHPNMIRFQVWCCNEWQLTKGNTPSGVRHGFRTQPTGVVGSDSASARKSSTSLPEEPPMTRISSASSANRMSSAAPQTETLPEQTRKNTSLPTHICTQNYKRETTKEGTGPPTRMTAKTLMTNTSHTQNNGKHKTETQCVKTELPNRLSMCWPCWPCLAHHLSNCVWTKHTWTIQSSGCPGWRSRIVVRFSVG